MKRILITLCCGLVALQCKQDPGFLDTGYSLEEPGADAVIHNFEASNYREKTLLWRMTSNTAYIYDTKKMTYFDGIDLVQYKGKKTSHITAGKGELDEKKQIMVVEESVVVKSANGRRLYTEYLLWNEVTQKMSTDRPVLIIFPEGDVIRGKHGMIADQRLDKIIILGASGVHHQENDQRSNNEEESEEGEFGIF